MGGFYGYSPENFTPDNSIWANVGGIAAETLMKIPEAIELEKTVQEGRLTNKDVYDATMAEIKELDDNEVKTFFGRSKEELMKIGKPGRNEGAEYLVRNTKIFGDGLTKAMAKKNLNQSLGEIKGQNESSAGKQNFENSVEGQMGIGGVAGAFGSAQPQGNMTPIGNGPSSQIGRSANPEDIQSIARRNNTPLEQLQPEMDIARAGRVAGQVGALDRTKTQGANIQNVASRQEPIEDTTMKAIGTFPNESQEAQNIISEKNAESQGIKASADMKKAEADLVGEGNKKADIVKQNAENFLKITEKAISDAQSKYNALQKQFVMATDEKEKKQIMGDMKKLGKSIEGYQKDMNDARKKIKTELGLPVDKPGFEPSKGTKSDTTKVMTAVKSGGDISEAIAQYAMNIENVTGKQLGFSKDKLNKYLDPNLPDDQRPSVSQIIALIRQQAGLE